MRIPVLFCCVVVSVSIAAAQEPVYAIKAARLFDGAGERVVEPGLVVVSGRKIVSVGGAVPAGATVIDLVSSGQAARYLRQLRP